MCKHKYNDKLQLLRDNMSTENSYPLLMEFLSARLFSPARMCYNVEEAD